jgi:hypothetical protein
MPELTMPQLRRSLFIWFALLVVGTILHGQAAGRWAAIDAESAAALLQNLPSEVGDWSAGGSVTLDARETAFETAAVHRVFRHRATGRALVLSLTAGRPAAVAVHTPDVCYVGSGFQPLSRVARLEMESAGLRHTLWQADFEKNGERLRVYWGWSTGGVFEAPDAPRWEFARAGRLFKLYAIHTLERDDALTIPAESLTSAASLINAVVASLRD